MTRMIGAVKNVSCRFVWLLFVAAATMAIAQTASAAGEHISYPANGIRFAFLPAALVNRDCDLTDAGVSCGRWFDMVPHAFIKTPPRPVHEGARVTATLNFSSRWQGWVTDAAAAANTPLFSIAMVFTKDGKIEYAQRKAIVLGDLWDQAVHMKHREGNQNYDYLSAHARHQEASLTFQIPVVDGRMVDVEVQLRELFSSVGVTVHSIVVEAIHAEDR